MGKPSQPPIPLRGSVRGTRFPNELDPSAEYLPLRGPAGIPSYKRNGRGAVPRARRNSTQVCKRERPSVFYSFGIIFFGRDRANAGQMSLIGHMSAPEPV